MTSPPRIAIRADATATMGTGHAMRCLALAQAAIARGLPVTFTGRIQVPWLNARLADAVSLTPLPGSAPARETPESVLSSLPSDKTTDWVVLDGYHFGADCQKALRAAGYRLVVIDDYAHLPEYHCDILLNQNIGAERLEYAGTFGTMLLGPTYALLRPEFLATRKQAERRVLPEHPLNILLSLGGGDFTTKLLELARLFTIPELRGRVLRVVAGAMADDSIRRALRDCPASIEIVRNVVDMPTLMLEADLAITAGGSTCWELCSMGVPFLTVEIAENQRELIAELHRQELSSPLSESTLLGMLQNSTVRNELRKRLIAAVPGDGASRLLNQMLFYGV